MEAYKKALKKLEGEIKEAFPDSAVRLSLVGEQVVVRGEAKDVVEAAQILRIVADHAPTAGTHPGPRRRITSTWLSPRAGAESRPR